MKWIYSLLKLFTLLSLVGALLLVGAGVGVYMYLEPKLPSIEHLREVKLQVPLRVYTREGKLIAEYGEKRRIPVTFEQLPPQMIDAFLAAEDDRFFQHPGVDYQGILRAASQLVMTGERRQGGSTITMQVARNFFLSAEKTYTRKLNEILLALKIEHELSKAEILELYLNKIYLGNRAYGVGAAAQVYYGKTLAELTLPENAMIAGLPKAPSRYNPIADPARALLRRNYVLGRMLETGTITPQEYEAAVATPGTARLHQADIEVEAPYVAEMARAEMVARYGNETYTDGFRAYTTIDATLQPAANQALRSALQAYDMRHGFRGRLNHIELGEGQDVATLDQVLKDYSRVAGLQPAIVTAVKDKQAELYMGEGRVVSLDWNGLSWASPLVDESNVGPAPQKAADILAPGDVIHVLETPSENGESGRRLAQLPGVEGALVAADPKDGAIKALVGGYDFYRSKFNRVTQAQRQPGSGLKPFIYSASLENGFTTASLINDAPVVFDDPGLEATWRPENYSGRFFGPTRLREALTHSRNLVSIRLVRAMGIETTRQHIAKFGFDMQTQPKDLSLALGSGTVTPLKMAEAYCVLANGGYRVQPYFLERIETSSGDVLFQAKPTHICSETTPMAVAQEGDCAPRVVSEQNMYQMNSMMRDVVQYGTAKDASVLKRQDLAGKTGTTNDQRDAWFNGFQASMVGIAWVGFDSSQPLGKGEVGGRAALPAWIDFMRVVLDGTPEKELELPPDMVTVRIDPKTGRLAAPDQRNAIFEVFRGDNVPEAAVGGGSTYSGGARSSPSPSADLF